MREETCPIKSYNKTIQYWQRNELLEQWNRMESPEIDTTTNLSYDISVIIINEERMDFSINGAGAAGEEWHWMPISHHIYLMPDELKI